MKRYLISLTILFSSCGPSYDKTDFEFNVLELSHFGDYQIGDTIYFESNFGDVDTITIVNFETERIEGSWGIIARAPSNYRLMTIRHLPIDRWHGTSRDMATGGKVEIVYQGLFSISKHPLNRRVDNNFEFKDFYSSTSSFSEQLNNDTVTLNSFSFSDFYQLAPFYPERIVSPENIESIYWTDKYGLTAYKNKGGEIWTIKEKR
jgi:hypothetical protein